jgi:hypothetical protein
MHKIIYSKLIINLDLNALIVAGYPSKSYYCLGDITKLKTSTNAKKRLVLGG